MLRRTPRAQRIWLHSKISQQLNLPSKRVARRAANGVKQAWRHGLSHALQYQSACRQACNTAQQCSRGRNGTARANAGGNQLFTRRCRFQGAALRDQRAHTRQAQIHQALVLQPLIPIAHHRLQKPCRYLPMYRQAFRHQAIQAPKPACREIRRARGFNQIKISFFKGDFIKKGGKLASHLPSLFRAKRPAKAARNAKHNARQHGLACEGCNGRWQIKQGGQRQFIRFFHRKPRQRTHARQQKRTALRGAQKGFAQAARGAPRWQ